MEVRNLVAGDFFEIEKHPSTEGVTADMPREQAELVAAQPCSRTITHDGKILGIGGVIERWPGRAECWAVLAPKTRPFIPEITKLVRAVLDSTGINRLEIAVRCDFTPGHEWAKALGFTKEADRLVAYDSEGYDCAMYARVKTAKSSPGESGE